MKVETAVIGGDGFADILEDQDDARPERDGHDLGRRADP